MYKIEHPSGSVFGLFCNCDLDSTFGEFNNNNFACTINPRLVTKDFQVLLNNQLNIGLNRDKIGDNFMEFYFTELPNNFKYEYNGTDRMLYPHNSPISDAFFYPDVFKADSGMVRMKFVYRKKSGEIIKEIQFNEHLNIVKTNEVVGTGEAIYLGLKKYSKEYKVIFQKILNAVFASI